MKKLQRLALVCILSVFICGVSADEEEHEHGRLDVFHEVQERLNVSGSVLPKAKVEEFFDGVLHRFHCKQNGSAVQGFESETQLATCSEKLCLDIDALFTLAGADVALGLDEEQFHVAAMSALYVLSRGEHPCNSTLNPAGGGTTLDTIRERLLASVASGGLITEESLETFIHHMEEHYEGIPHDHGEDDHGDDDDHADHDDHEGHEHRRRKRASHEHGDHEDDHGHEHEEEDDGTAVVEAKCLAPDAVMYYLSADDKSSINATETIDDVATVIVYLMYQASAIEEKCRMLPKKSDFVNNLIARFMGSEASYLDMNAFFNLMDRFEIIPQIKSDHGHDDHAGHDHRRRRRSVADDVRRMTSRVKRQAMATTTTSDLRCYTPPQLLAVFETGNNITAAQLTQMSPALIYQKLFTQCITPANQTSSRSTDNMRYLYGTITVVIVCLCSLGGVIFLPCMSKRVYHLLLALFIGLGVGSLAGDALLHLIPVTMGAHQHNHAHEHGSGDIVIEKYVWYAVVTLVGIYAFFILESIFTRYLYSKTTPGQAGHSHSYDLHNLPGKGDEAGKGAEATETSNEEKGNMAVCIMIILGDAVHNFADGLAIGASFSLSNSVGIATGIAIFCHELPHELGDFAILLKNGMSVKRAVFWNFFSALTALLGLYVALPLSTTEGVQMWIFAIAAGMFLYIALVDLMPQMTARDNITNNALFAMNNIGILLGFVIMLIIAIFEEHIKI